MNSLAQPRLMIKGKYPVEELYAEVNALRRRDNEEPIGGLAFYRKVWSHFNEDHNPRVAEAFQNLDKRMNP